MSFQFDFYGSRVITKTEDGHIYVSVQSVTDLFGLPCNESTLSPLLGFMKDGFIHLRALQQVLPAMAEHAVNRCQKEFLSELETSTDIIIREFTESVVKHLTYKDKALPLIMPDNVESGILVYSMLWDPQGTYFIPQAIHLLSGRHVFNEPIIPLELPSRYLMVRENPGRAWGMEGKNRDVLQEVVDIKFLGSILKWHKRPPVSYLGDGLVTPTPI